MWYARVCTQKYQRYWSTSNTYKLKVCFVNLQKHLETESLCHLVVPESPVIWRFLLSGSWNHPMRGQVLAVGKWRCGERKKQNISRWARGGALLCCQAINYRYIWYKLHNLKNVEHCGGEPEQAANCWFTILSWHTAGFVTKSSPEKNTSITYASHFSSQGS